MVADEISDFQIEGISIGDSLLDHYSEEEILKEIERNLNFYVTQGLDNTFVEVYFFLIVLSKNNLARYHRY